MVRGKLLFDVSEQFSLLVTADYAEINAEASGTEVLNSTNTPAFEAATTAAVRLLAGNGRIPTTGKLTRSQTPSTKTSSGGLSY